MIIFMLAWYCRLPKLTATSASVKWTQWTGVLWYEWVHIVALTCYGTGSISCNLWDRFTYNIVNKTIEIRNDWPGKSITFTGCQRSKRLKPKTRFCLSLDPYLAFYVQLHWKPVLAVITSQKNYWPPASVLNSIMWINKDIFCLWGGSCDLETNIFDYLDSEAWMNSPCSSEQQWQRSDKFCVSIM